MRKSYFCYLALFLVSCLSEKSVDPATEATFTRYFSDGYVNEPIAVEETPDKGFIILANTNIKNSDADLDRNRILLIKTDMYGNEEWTSYFPDKIISNTQAKRWFSKSLILLPSGGYLITGEEIQPTTGIKQVLLLQVNETGEKVSTPTDILPTNVGTTGLAVTIGGKNGASNYLLLATSPETTNNIHISEINSSTLATEWTRAYGEGPSKLANRIFFTDGATPFVYWGGEVRQEGSSSDGFITKCKLDAQLTENGVTVPIGSPANNDFGGDYCRKGNGFAFVDYTVTSTDLGNIAFYQVSDDGLPGEPTIYNKEIFDDTVNINNKKEEPNSIIATNDGGFMILATIDTYTEELGRGNTDLLLLKINGLGGKKWVKPYGSIDADGGAMIRQTSDGGYIVLGYARIAALKSLLLIKTDRDGDVD